MCFTSIISYEYPTPLGTLNTIQYTITPIHHHYNTPSLQYTITPIHTGTLLTYHFVSGTQNTTTLLPRLPELNTSHPISSSRRLSCVTLYNNKKKHENTPIIDCQWAKLGLHCDIYVYVCTGRALSASADEDGQWQIISDPPNTSISRECCLRSSRHVLSLNTAPPLSLK